MTAARGRGTAWYVAVELAPAARTRLAAEPVRRSAARVLPHRSGLDTVLRRSADRDCLFLVNHAAEEAVAPGSGTDLLDGSVHGGAIAVPPGAVRAVAHPARTAAGT
jgi:beta-galactosidase